ncbi:MAG: aldolase/citrate lyase family protein [Negativicutes bacterium]|nr:aldolase/citrate lyase family protein [Negativicutes bacterium]
MFKNRLKKTLKEGKPAFGIFAMCNSPDLIEIIGLAGFDFVIIDTEHGPLTVESTQHLIRAAELRDLTPIIRVTEGTETIILRSLDVGAHGIQVPQVNDPVAARKLVEYAKYYPEGRRGIAMPRAANYGAMNITEYLKASNEETLVVTHCENKECLDNLEKIAQTPGIDVIFLGPFDMSQSLGIPGQVSHPLIQDAAKRIVEVCRANGKAAGIFVANGEQAKKRAEEGFQYIAIGMDIILFKRICEMEISAAGK